MFSQLVELVFLTYGCRVQDIESNHLNWARDGRNLMSETERYNYLLQSIFFFARHAMKQGFDDKVDMDFETFASAFTLASATDPEIEVEKWPWAFAPTSTEWKEPDADAGTFFCSYMLQAVLILKMLDPELLDGRTRAMLAFDAF